MPTSILLLKELDLRARDVAREAVSRERPSKTGAELAAWDVTDVCMYVVIV